MTESVAKSWWESPFPQVTATVHRFPLAVAIAAAFTLYALTLADMSDVALRVLQFLVASFLWVVAVDFFAESWGHGFPARALLWLGGMLVLALLFWLAWDIWLVPWLLLGGLLLLPTLAGHLGRGETNETFWLFNNRLVLAVLLAGFGSVLLLVGTLATIQTVDFLFGPGVPQVMFQYAWTISLGLIAPISFLALAPRSFADPISKKEEAEFTFRAVAALVKFVLVPLLLVYTTILYAYAAKIALAWELPKGTLGLMVMVYLLIGAATLLLAYPSRDTSGPLVRLFWRYWVWLTALPVLLLFIAVFRRIADYGVTEPRYLIVLIGIWALMLAGARIVSGERFDLRIVPGALALLMLAGSFGPGGAVGFSVMSQKEELAEILSEKGVLVDGKIVPQTSADSALYGDQAWRVRGIAWYLNMRRSLGVLAPWFEGLLDDPFAPGKTPEETVRGAFTALGLTPGVLPPESRGFPILPPGAPGP
jgi:hypothetical protein